LVVDDNEALSENIADVLVEGLVDFQIEYQHATTARRALELAAASDLDLVLLDLHLPDFPGTSIISEITTRAVFAQVVVITGDSAVESALAALHKGASAYVIKPFDTLELIETARRAIERARLLRERQEMELRTRRAERLAAVGTLAAGLAHEVRNPLNSASLQLQVLARRLAKDPKAAAEYAPLVEVVHAEIRRLDRLVSDFLAFAHPRPLNLERVDVSELVLKVCDLIRPEAEALGVELRTELAAGEKLVSIELERMQQVLINLMRNGVEAMPSGGIVTVRAAALRGKVQLEVQDDGPGFPETTPVFDAFFTTKDHGTGLGLAIVHRIVSEHGGTITVTSKPGNTCFTIVLPAVGR
jgi:signal transduction histidine kinase